MIDPTSASSVSGPAPVDPAAPARRRRPAAPAAPPAAVTQPIPAAPPQEVLDGLDTAARVLNDLDAKQVDLHLAVDDHTGRVHVELRDAEGQVLRRVPSGQALDLLAGEQGGIADWQA
jgi:hypothetical protein